MFGLEETIPCETAEVNPCATIQGPEGPCLGGMGVNGSLSPGTLCAIVQMFAWVMNPGVVARKASAPAQPIECSARCREQAVLA